MRLIKDSKVFVDTNIIVYAHSVDEEHKRKISQQIIATNFTVISTQVLQEFANTLGRKFNLLDNIIKKALEECILNNDVLHVNNHNTVFKACDINSRYRYSFYDSLNNSGSSRKRV